MSEIVVFLDHRDLPGKKNPYTTGFMSGEHSPPAIPATVLSLQKIPVFFAL
jgi:hypothetical protein